MIPGMNPRQMRQAMKRMGIKQEEIDATEVIIRTQDKEIVITSPQVSKVNMGGMDSYQISGTEQIRPIDSTPDISQEDIETVKAQTDASIEDIKITLNETKGDLAEAILKLNG